MSYNPQDPNQGGFEPPQQPPQQPQPPQPPPGYGQQPPPQAPGYGQQPPPGYGQQPPPGYGYGGPPQPETDSSATVALIVAIASVVLGCFPLGIVGLILSSKAKRKIEESGGRLGGLGMVTAARILSIIAIALFIVGAIIGVILLVAGNSTSTINY
jgi:hypothetical protein